MQPAGTGQRILKHESILRIIGPQPSEPIGCRLRVQDSAQNASSVQAYHRSMNLLEALAGAFINTFGITQPTDKTRRQTAWFIFGMLLLVVCGLSVGAVVIFRAIRG
jgi:hypothetical protein